MLSNISFVYYGTSEFSAVILDGLLSAGFKPTLVVSTVARPAGRGLKLVPTPVAALATEKKLSLLEVKTLKSPEVQARLASGQEPVAILAAFGKIIPPAVLALYPQGIINVHPSLLPLYRGPAPIQYALRDGLTKTGVSLIVLDEAVDHGPILTQESCPIDDEADAQTLSKKLADLSIKLLLTTLPGYLTSSVSARPQDHAQATGTKMISRDDGRADFNQTAQAINNQRRAFTPWPGLWTTWQNKRLKLIDTAVQPAYNGLLGQVELKDNQLLVACGQGGLIIKRLQLEGGKPMSAAEFVRGYPTIIKTHLTV
jgi:methionyl-tRNA formyltransferase